jgi:hypothetical protein
MKKKPLSETNPYLRNKTSRAVSTATTVVSSSAIEGIHISNIDEKTAKWSVAASGMKKRLKT